LAGKKDLIPAMLELAVKKPSMDVLGALILLLTGEKAELQVHRLNNEAMLKKVGVGQSFFCVLHADA
jgi:hypothetical protein